MLFIFVIVFTLFIVFGLWFSPSSRNIELLSTISHAIARVLSWLNLMDFNSRIGGHHAHLHTLVWVGNLQIAVLYSISAAYLIGNKIKAQLVFSQIWLGVIFFLVYSVVTFSFFVDLERLAYTFFVPQM